jgi:hypothetical protein
MGSLARTPRGEDGPTEVALGAGESIPMAAARLEPWLGRAEWLSVGLRSDGGAPSCRAVRHAGAFCLGDCQSAQSFGRPQALSTRAT